MLTPEQTRVDVRLKAAIKHGTLAKETVVSGPAGTGKTYSILRVLHALLRDYPGLRILICRKTRKALTESALVTYEQGVLAAAGMERIAHGVQRRVRQSYKYPSGSELVVAGLDDPEKVKSSEWDLIYPNECTELTENDWEFLSSRQDRPGRLARLNFLLGDCNPDSPNHWIKKRAEAGQTDLWVTTHEANPAMYDGRNWTEAGRRYIARLDTLTGVRYLRLRKGLWAGAEGIIYDEFEPATHVIDGIPIPPEWRRFRSVDFGYTNAFVCQWWAMDGDGRLHLYRELYGTKRIVSDWAKDIIRLSEGEKIEATITDHDAEDRATLDASGIGSFPAWKQVKPGIEAVQQRLRKQGDGRPRLYLHRNALVSRDPLLVEAKKPVGTLEEIEGYVWAPGPDGKAAKEEPLKVSDHGMDAMRYIVAHVDGLGCYSAGAY